MSVTAKIGGDFILRILNGFAGPTAIYMGSTGINAVATALLIPVLVANLSPHDYGILALFQSLFSIVTTITFFNMRAPIVRELTVNGDGASSHYISTALVLTCALTCVLMIAATFFQGIAERIFHLSLWIILVVILCGGAQSLYQAYLAVLQAKVEAWRYAILQTIMVAGNAGLTLGLLYAMHLGWVSRVVGYFVFAIAGCTYALVHTGKRGLYNRVKSAHALELLKLGGATVAAVVVVANFDRIVLGALFTPTDAGLYTLASQFSSVITMFGSALMLALSPWAYRKMSTCQTPADWLRVYRVLGVVAVAIAIVAISVVVLSQLVLGLFPLWNYTGLLTYLPWLCASSCFAGLYAVYVPVLYYFKSATMLTGSAIVLAATNAVLLVALPQFFGPVGIAASLCIARLVQILCVLVGGVYLARRAALRIGESSAVMCPDGPVAD